METQPLLDSHKVKYHVKLQSGRDFILNSSEDHEQAAWDAYDEAATMDDYLHNITPICDV